MKKMNNNEFRKIEKGDFIAIVKIYGKRKLIGEYYENFTSNSERLYRKDLKEIEEYIVEKSNIPESQIAFTTVDIMQCDML